MSRLVTASAIMDEAFSFEEGIAILVSPGGPSGKDSGVTGLLEERPKRQLAEEIDSPS